MRLDFPEKRRQEMLITPEHEKLQYSGRIDWSDRNAPVFVFPCTSVGMWFTEDTLKVYVRNKKVYWDNYLGCILDGEQTKLRLPDEGEAVIEIPVNQTIEDGSHEVLLFKRQDSCHEAAFLGFEVEDGAEILDPPKRPRRRIEVYGDSVSAGEVSEAVDYVGKPDPEHNGQYSNSWYSYAWMTARKLGAEIHDIAQGGIALLDGTGWFNEPDYIGMETAWNKIHYNPAFGPAADWDFTQYTPQVVIVAIGQNDNHPEDYMKEDYNCPRSVRWRREYGELLKKIRGRYPDAWILCITTLLEHDPSWDQSIDEVCGRLQDEKIRHFVFRRNGRGTPGHLRIPEAEEMAEELSAYIEELDIQW